MSDIKRIPKLRFPGFTDAWEQRKLEKVAQITMGQSPSSKNYTDNPNDYILVQGNADMRDGRVLPRVWTTQVTKQAEKDDLILSVRAPVGDVGKTDYDVVLGRGVAGIRGNEFIFQLLTRMKANGYWEKLSTGSTFDSINSSDIKEAIVLIPSIKEQSQIGVFFSNLDNLITLHQHKLDKLDEFKKAMLSKMFPKTGESAPELRFPEFTNAWEQRKFETMLDSKEGIRRGPFGSALKKEYFVPESEFVVYEQQNAIYGHFETRYNITEEKYNELIRFKLNDGDFIMSGAGTIGRISKVPKGIKKGVFNQALIRFRINNDITDPEYFVQYVRSDDMQRKLTSANPGSAITNLVPMSEVKKWNILVPAKNEQEQIGSFFKELDNLITLHQRKLDKLNELKKAFLNEMFV